MAYSEIPEEEGTVTIDRNARSGRPGATTTPGGARPTARTTSAATPSSRSAVRSRPTSTGSTRAGAVSGPLSISAVVGFVLSGLGFFLVTVPFGLWLGYRGLQETENAAREGYAFAKWAVYLGWAWVVFWILALIAYLWILL